MPVETFRQQVEAFRDVLHGSAPAQGFSGVLVPGEPESRARTASLRDGVEVPEGTAAELAELGARLDLDLPPELQPV